VFFRPVFKSLQNTVCVRVPQQKPQLTTSLKWHRKGISEKNEGLTDFALTCVFHFCFKRNTLYLWSYSQWSLGNNGCCLCFHNFLPIWKL